MKRVPWQPSASIATLKQRAKLVGLIREFFAKRNCTEVCTPAIAATTVSDPGIASLELLQGASRYYLQTSPEQHMKRLLAAGMGDCYQICQSFRNDPPTKKHNPEFTMLEWYRIGFDLKQLIDETCKLTAHLTQLDSSIIPSISYATAWLTYLPGDSPHSMSKTKLLGYCNLQEQQDLQNLEADQIRDLIFATRVQPKLIEPVVITDFPADSCAMAQTHKIQLQDTQVTVADRFEFYWKGSEIANGYNELLNPAELQLRYQNDARTRARRNLPNVAEQTQLIQAMHNGLPRCAGVALGVDRLLMCLLEKTRLEEVIAFPFECS